MIVTLATSVIRVFLFWYGLGVLFMFLGDPAWATAAYERLAGYPGVPELPQQGLIGAAKTQWVLLTYWTLPAVLLSVGSILAGLGLAKLGVELKLVKRKQREAPRGRFWDVEVESFSLGALPMPTVPMATAKYRVLPGSHVSNGVPVKVDPVLDKLFRAMTEPERTLCEELLQLLCSYPDHYAGQGHGVTLLVHTLNVLVETADRCSEDFRLPVIAALAHDVGKLITFKKAPDGSWYRKGLHSREGVRILVTLSGYQALPPRDRDALMLAIKYDHAPNKMPALAGSTEAHNTAQRIISALSRADRTATAQEKDRHLERLKPEDLLWQDFVEYLRDAPVVQKGRPGVANQVNNPEGEYLYVYEAPWREAAVRRLPAEVAAALDLTRRDSGKLAKYTKYLTDRLRTEGLLLETYESHSVSDANPLWDIQSGTGEKAVVLRGILVLKADLLWRKLNYKLGVRSPYPVKILAPNAQNAQAPSATAPANKPTPAVADRVVVGDLTEGGLSMLGLRKSSGQPYKKPVDSDERIEPTLLPIDAPVADTVPEESVQREPMVPPAEPAPSPLEPVAPKPVPALDPLAVALGALAAPDASPAAEVPPVAAPVVTAKPKAETPPADEPTAIPVPAAKPERAPKPVAIEVGHVPGLKKPGQGPGGPAPAPTLTRSEQLAGVAIADKDAVTCYPHLKIGQKYYTEAAEICQHGTAPGTPYTPKKEKPKAPAFPTGIPGLKPKK